MNACKHRKICEATRDCLRLRPKGKQSGSGPSTWPDANTRTAGVKSEPKSSCDCCGTWKRCGPRPASLDRLYRKAGQEAQHWDVLKRQSVEAWPAAASLWRGNSIRAERGTGRED